MKKLIDKNTLEILLHDAFLSGRWRGQVDLEEYMDNSFLDAAIFFNESRKTSRCVHSVASNSLNDRPVRYFLRSDKWREGVKKTTNNELKSISEEFFK